MTGFESYISAPRTAERPSAAELDALAGRFGWFMPLRIARARASGVEDALWEMLSPWRAQSSLCAQLPEAADFTAFSSDDIIERFLREEDLRIVAGEGDDPDGEVRTEAQLDGDDEVVSEELAEIYIAQGLRDRAAEIYRKLSLLNPEKSVYFATLISKLENNN